MVQSVASFVAEHWGTILGAASGLTVNHWYRHAHNPWCVVSAKRIIKTYGDKDDAIKHAGTLRHSVLTGYVIRLRDMPKEDRVYV